MSSRDYEKQVEAGGANRTRREATPDVLAGCISLDHEVGRPSRARRGARRVVPVRPFAWPRAR
jgi:hypothetical protein